LGYSDKINGQISFINPAASIERGPRGAQAEASITAGTDTSKRLSWLASLANVLCGGQHW